MDLTKEQEEVLIGNLLGDGYLTLIKNGNINSRFCFSQKLANSEYVKWLYEY